MTVRPLNALLIAFLLSILAPGIAAAHSDLEETDPADGDTITTPYTLTARFSEEFDADRSSIRVIDADGTVVAEGAVSPDDPVVMVVELPELAGGEYEVRWQTVTPDDNGVERDTFTFTVADAPTPNATPSASSAAATTSAPSTSVPTSSVVTAPPTVALSPAASPVPADGAPAGSGSDLVLALVLAAVAIGAVLLFIFARNRR